MNKNVNRACPICSGLEKAPLFRQRFNNGSIFLMASYEVVACKNCGFTFADEIPAPADFDNYYATMSKYEFNYQGGQVADEYIDYFRKIFNFLSPYFKDKEAKILDIGCSTGGLLSVFKSNGYLNILGIDPAPACLKIANELYGIPVVVNTIDNFNSTEKFDLIILSAVLEHLADFEYSMQKIRALLNEFGLLFIAVPDAEKFSLYISAPFQQFSTEHINYFSRYSLKNLLSRFSFKELETRRDQHKLNQTTDPEILSLSKKMPESAFKIIPDKVSEPRLRDYLAACSALNARLRQTIKEKLAGKNKIIVWGVGTHTQRLIGQGLDISKILFFVDSNRRYVGQKLSGLKVKRPEEIKEDAPILISTYSYQDEIIKQIKTVLKLKNELITLY